MSVSDSDDSGSFGSMLHVGAATLYPLRPAESHDTDEPGAYSPLSGERVEFKNRITDGVLTLSNYRIYFRRAGGSDGKGDFNIPLGLVETADMKDLFHIHFSCKDARTFRCSFPTNDMCLEWFRKIAKAISPPKDFDELYAFVYYAYARDKGLDDLSLHLGRDNCASEYIKLEFERLRFGTVLWRLTAANEEFKLCPSYPKHVIVPASISDSLLEKSARFRTMRRFPGVVWRHRENGMVLARCSQPEIGFLGWRSDEDEKLVKAIHEACARSYAELNQKDLNVKDTKLLIMDARSFTTAMANRARGGGFEFPEYYVNSEIVFMNLANIHTIRKSFSALRSLCASPPNLQTWNSMLENTKWLQNMSLLMAAAVRLVRALDQDVRPALVHCSDGWDRTAQLVSLAELLLDPYYRTLEGFQVLCEKEWLEFGHKFEDRCGTGDDPNEKCPVFLQWLDCVHNIMEQFPCAFEFSKRYLIKLAEHTYSNLFGTFLCNTTAERQKLGIPQRTFSVWRYLNSHQLFKNQLFNPVDEKVLIPRTNVRDLEVWKDLYIDFFDDQIPADSVHTLSETSSQPTVNGEAVAVKAAVAVDGEPLTNGNLSQLGDGNLGSMLESAINCQPEGGEYVNGDATLAEDYEDIPVGEKVFINRDCHTYDDLEATYDAQVVSTTNIDDAEDTPEAVVNGTAEFIPNGDVFPEVDVANEVDESVRTSVETIVDSTSTLTINDFCDSTDNGKVVLNGVKTIETLNVYGHGRQQITSLLLDPIDGLPLVPDDVQDRMQQITIEQKAQQAALRNELHSTRYELMNKLCNQCVHQNGNSNINNQSDKQIVSDDDKGSVCSTEISWEAVDEKDVGQVLWVPDYAVNFCTSCNSRFWLGRRKHHCRGCGKIFCADCSRKVITLPSEQLFDPVRVCEQCYQLTERTPFGSGVGVGGDADTVRTTCKQAAGRQNDVVVPPTAPI